MAIQIKESPLEDTLNIWLTPCTPYEDCEYGSKSFTVASEKCGDIIRRDSDKYVYNKNEDGSVNVAKTALVATTRESL